MKKIAIVGAGRVGEATAEFLAQNDECRDLVLLDVREGAAEGTALDIQESAPLFRFDTRVRGGTDAKLMTDAELVIVTAGFPRKPGMSRSDVMGANIPIIDAIVDDVLRYAPDAMLLVVGNPVDVLTYRAWQRTGWGRHRVFGQAGVLDSARMAAFVALETGFSAQDIDAMVMGGHGDSMVPMTRYTCINGVPIDQFLNQEAIERIVQRTRQGGAEVLALRKSSSAYESPAAAVAAMVDAIAHNRRRLLPTVCILDGEYGEHDVAMGVPAILAARGVERVVELALNDEEAAMFKSSVGQVRADLGEMAKLTG